MLNPEKCVLPWTTGQRSGQVLGFFLGLLTGRWIIGDATDQSSYLAVMVCTITWKTLVQLPVSLWLPGPDGTRSAAEANVLNSWRKRNALRQSTVTPANKLRSLCGRLTGSPSSALLEDWCQKKTRSQVLTKIRYSIYYSDGICTPVCF